MRVWAPDLPSLLAEAAKGMNTLAGAAQAQDPRLKRMFEAEGLDPESLLVAFLSELIYYQEQENLAFDTFDIQLLDRRISANMEGAPLASLSKAIKAVTYHNLKIEKTGRGLEATVVFDV